MRDQVLPTSVGIDGGMPVQLSLLLAFSVFLLVPAPAYAGDILCSIVTLFYSSFGRGLATLAVLFLGIGATIGKVSWGMAIMVAVGIAVMFNAATVVQDMGYVSC